MVSQENTIRCAVKFRHRCSMCRAGEVAELLTRQQPDDLPVLNDASTIEQITHIEFWTLEQLEFELATFTPMAWVDIFSLRLSLWQQQQQQRRSQTNSHIQPHPPVPSEFLAASGCRSSRPEFPFLFSFCSQSDRRNCLICVNSAVGTAERFCSARNSCQRSALSLKSSLVCSCLSCCPPHHFTLLLPRFRLFLSGDVMNARFFLRQIFLALSLFFQKISMC